jgi:glycosyltransferase involved in cell wall biosynthesis
MAAPLISVIVPCHNYGKYVGEAIESIQHQTYESWELLVIDDGSSDDTQAVVQRYCQADARITYHYQAQQGVSAARNNGFSRAKGEYLQLLDADDLLAPQKFERQLALFEAHPTASLVYGDAYSFTHQPGTHQREFAKFTLAKSSISGVGYALALHMAADNIFLISSPLFKRAMLQVAPGFNQRILAFEDWEFWSRAVLQGAEFIYAPEEGTGFYVRAHGGNTTGNRHKMWQHKIKARESVMRSIEELLAKNTAKELKALYAAHRAFYYEESARFNLLYANVLTGLLDTVQYSLKGEKPFRIWYDSAYWLKERLLRRQ